MIWLTIGNGQCDHVAGDDGRALCRPEAIAQVALVPVGRLCPSCERIAAGGAWELAPAAEAIYAPIRKAMRKAGIEGAPGCAYCAVFGQCVLHALEGQGVL